jgi:osmotically inducible lipoprotein OsmB
MSQTWHEDRGHGGHWVRRTLVVMAIGGLLTLGMTGCPTHQQTGALAGGVLGGGAGAGIGAILGGKHGAIAGGAIGTILGTTTGAVIGERFDAQAERTRAQSVQSIAYKPTQGNTLIVAGLEALPAVAEPGGEVKIKLTYDVLAPDPRQPMPVTETWVFSREHTELATIKRPVQYRVQGGHSSTYVFAVTKDMLPGSYQVLVNISNGEQHRSVTAPFSIQL